MARVYSTIDGYWGDAEGLIVSDVTEEQLDEANELPESEVYGYFRKLSNFSFVDADQADVRSAGLVIDVGKTEEVSRLKGDDPNTVKVFIDTPDDAVDFPIHVHLNENVIFAGKVTGMVERKNEKTDVEKSNE